MSTKDPEAMMVEADGEPRWMREVLEEIWRRLPPVPPQAPPATEQLPSWDHSILAKLVIDPTRVPLSSTNRWHLAGWLKQIAATLIEGTEEPGSVLTISPAEPSSGPRERRGER